MRESRTSGSARGARSNPRPYRAHCHHSSVADRMTRERHVQICEGRGVRLPSTHVARCRPVGELLCKKKAAAAVRPIVNSRRAWPAALRPLGHRVS
jgi:hypothetical protein